jgi:prepilin-type processing-associated H-X9-DG protein
MSGVKRRHSILLTKPEGEENRHSYFPEPTSEMDKGPTISARMMLYEHKAPPMAVEASKAALAKSETKPEAITHLITVSCSGFSAPGVDVTLMRDLGLKNTVQRVHVGFMGCHGALNGLRAARGIAESEPKARILLCAVELCSLHYHYGWDPEQVIANALFADGSAALVGGAGNGVAPDAWRIGATGSCLIPDSEDAMTWNVRDNGFVMSLSARVPDLICTYLKDWMEAWLGESNLTLADIQSWAVHPGGPRILSSVLKALELEKEALGASKEILRDYGNMSSPTILFILNKLREQNAPRPCVALAFGPGLMAEAVLFV